jgi:predicted porin
MKKTLIAVAALAATGAFAQVSVYGRLDAGYAATTNTANGVDTKANGVQSHNSVSSFWGIQGSEDLGGGMKAMFKLEQDVYPATGDEGVTGAKGGGSQLAQFNRTSLVGLSGGFGTVSFGRDYVPTFKLIGATDVNALSRISTVQLSASSGVSTTDSLVMYSTPVMSGFQVNVAYRNADQTKDGAGDTYQKLTNLTATYSNGPLMVGVGTGSTESKGTGTSNTGVSYTGLAAAISTAEKVSSNVVAASYDFGKFALKGNYITSKAQNVSAGVDNEMNELNIGATVPMGKVTLIAQAGSQTLKVTGADDRKGTDFVLGVDYALSAKTALFAKTGTYGKMDAAVGGGEYKSTSTAVGIKTVF